MTTLQEAAMRKALEAMQQVHGDYHLMPGRVGPKEAFAMMSDAIESLRTALAQQWEPVGSVQQKLTGNGGVEIAWDSGKAPAIGTKLYTAAPAPVAQDCKCKRLGDFDGTNHHPLCDSAPAPQPVSCAAGSFMTREHAIEFCRRIRPSIEPTEQHITATIDAYSALFGNLAPAPQPAQGEPDQQLCKFYQVENFPDLVAAMEKHIERLQAKLPPLRDTQPGRVREG